MQSSETLFHFSYLFLPSPRGSWVEFKLWNNINNGGKNLCLMMSSGCAIEMIRHVSTKNKLRREIPKIHKDSKVLLGVFQHKLSKCPGPSGEAVSGLVGLVGLVQKGTLAPGCPPLGDRCRSALDALGMATLLIPFCGSDMTRRIQSYFLFMEHFITLHFHSLSFTT